MSSRSPRNAQSPRSKAPVTGPRKRTQEVETGEVLEENATPPLTEAEPPSEGATAVELASSALDAADLALRSEQVPPPPETPIALEVEAFFNAPEHSALSREILGAAAEHGGDWVDIRPSVPAPPPSPIEIFDRTEQMSTEAEGEAGGKEDPSPLMVAAAAEEAADDAASVVLQGRERDAPAESSAIPGAPFPSTSLASMADEEFLRRVVLPPLPQPAGAARPLSAPPPYDVKDGDQGGDDDGQDKTTISSPPTEMFGVLAAPSPRGRSFARRLSARIEIRTIELAGLLLAAALAGGIVGALFFAVPQAGANGVVAPRPAVTLSPPAVPLPQDPDPAPLPRPTVESLPSAAERAAAAEEESSHSSDSVVGRASSPRRSGASSRKASKKEWVDPFER